MTRSQLGLSLINSCCALALVTATSPARADDDTKTGVLAALGLSAASGKTTAPSGVGAIEAGILSSDAYNQAGAIIAIGTSVAAPVAARDQPIGGIRPVIRYFLPRTKVSAAIAARITECPTDNGKTQTRSFKVEYTPAVDAKSVPDRLVAIDASSGFLADRATKITFTDGLVIKEFNSSTTGQGGPLIASIVKTAAVGYSLFAAPITSPAVLATAKSRSANPSNLAEFLVTVDGEFKATPQPKMTWVHRYFLECKDEVTANLEKLAERQDQLEAAEDRLISGTSGANIQAVIDERKAQIADLKAKLTLKSAPDGAVNPTLDKDGNLTGLVADLPATQFEKWFKVADRPELVRADSLEAKRAVKKPPPLWSVIDLALAVDNETVLVGRYGYRLTIKVDAQLAAQLSCGRTLPVQCAKQDGRADTVTGRDLIYRVPVPASAQLVPIYCKPQADVACNAPSDWGSEATTSLAVKLPQLARLSSLRTGGGGIFGSKKVAAEFDATGSPVSLEYDKGSASKDVASIADALATAGPTVRDARSAALTRAYNEDKTWQDLQDLLDKQLSETP